MSSKADSLAQERADQKRQAMERRFRSLAEQWKRETAYLSNVAKKAMHPAYQGIIGLGEPAVPLILEELQQDPADWFWALAAITGENPVRESSAGNIEEMADAWLRWGREQGLTLESK
jgi:hypothetical protein